MASGNSSKRASRARKASSIGKALTPLFAASPPPSSGRIRSLAEARSALIIPTSADPEVLNAWGVPPDFRLVAFPVADQEQPDVLAEFATLLVLRRQGRHVVRGQPAKRLRLREKSNTLWVVFGPLVRAADGTLVIGALTIAPAFHGQLSRKSDDIALGITNELLRLLSPARLLSETVEYLQRANHWSKVAAEQHGTVPLPDSQREVLHRIEQGRPRQSRIPEQQIVALAQRYLVLYLAGQRRPLPQLAREFGLTREQTRDRIHKARRLGYLKGGKQGRAGAEIGPRLEQLGWNPPLPDPNAQTSSQETEEQPTPTDN